MPDLSGFPYQEVQFTKDGAVHDAAEVAGLLSMVNDRSVTDLVVIAHGWNNDLDQARALYREFFRSLRTVLDGAHGPDLGNRVIAVLGVLWPSKKFADVDLIAGGAADTGGSPGDAELEEALDQLAAALDDPAAATKLATAEALIPALPDDPAAQKKFADTVRSVLPKGGNGDQDTPPGFFSLSGDQVIARLAKPLPLEAVTPAPPGVGGVVEVGELGPPPGDGGGASLGDFFSGVKAGALKLVNYSTYYLMKQRAGIVGALGVSRVLRTAKADQSAVRLHLVGHSFGGRLVTAAAAACADDPVLRIASLTLLQAAFSHHGFAEKFDGSRDGFFRHVVARKVVQGPVLITHTRRDTAVGYLYPVASLLAGDDAAELGDANDRFGGIGRNGAQHTPEARPGSLLALGGTYSFGGDVIYNLEGSTFITDHGAVTGEQVAYAFGCAVAVSMSG
jgi:pimeloyl-ACP methyl ester carboxylesterase